MINSAITFLAADRAPVSRNDSVNNVFDKAVKYSKALLSLQADEQVVSMVRGTQAPYSVKTTEYFKKLGLWQSLKWAFNRNLSEESGFIENKPVAYLLAAVSTFIVGKNFRSSYRAATVFERFNEKGELHETQAVFEPTPDEQFGAQTFRHGPDQTISYSASAVLGLTTFNRTDKQLGVYITSRMSALGDASEQRVGAELQVVTGESGEMIGVNRIVSTTHEESHFIANDGGDHAALIARTLVLQYA